MNFLWILLEIMLYASFHVIILFCFVLFSFCSRELMRDLFKILNPEEFSPNIHFFSAYYYYYYSPFSYSSFLVFCDCLVFRSKEFEFPFLWWVKQTIRDH